MIFILKPIGMIAGILGFLLGVMVRDCIRTDYVDFNDFLTRGGYITFGVLAIYLLLTILILMMRPEKFGFSRRVTRLVWFLSFIMGAILGPLFLWLAV